jgi:hypothetical protein
VNITVSVAAIGYSGTVNVYDIWAGENVASVSTEFSAAIPLHGTGFYRFSATS